jgi:CRP-like cAMP-binding protein
MITGSILREFLAGQVLFQEGEASTSFFIVTHGAVSIRKKKDKNYIELAKVAQNEVLGELSFFDREPRSATAVAITNVKTLEITFESLDKIYAPVPDYMKTIMASVASRLRKANDTIRLLQAKSLPNEEAGTSLWGVKNSD